MVSLPRIQPHLLSQPRPGHACFSYGSPYLTTNTLIAKTSWLVPFLGERDIMGNRYAVDSAKQLHIRHRTSHFRKNVWPAERHTCSIIERGDEPARRGTPRWHCTSRRRVHRNGNPMIARYCTLQLVGSVTPFCLPRVGNLTKGEYDATQWTGVD